jgi:Flp pilus assembly protein TadG
MAIILPLLMVLVFGILEYGLVFKDKLTLASATSSAARTGATMGTEEAADHRILEALEAGLYSQVDSSVLVSVEIFRADEATGQKVLTDVNTYVYKSTLPCKWDPCPDPAMPGGPFYGGTWTPVTRNTTLTAGGGGLDVLGIEVTYFHKAITALIPGVERNYTERALVRLEPDTFGSGP